MKAFLAYVFLSQFMLILSRGHRKISMVPDHVWFGHVSRGTLIIVRILSGKFKKRWMEEIGLRKMRYKEYIVSQVIP